MQKTLLALLVAMAFGWGAHAWWQQGKISDQARKISALERTIAARDSYFRDAERAAQKLEQENKAFNAESAALRDKLAAQQTTAPTPEPAGAPVAAASPSPGNPFGGMMEKMLKNPKMLDAIAAQQMAVIKPMYADLVRQLKLTPEETAQFFELLGAQTSKAMQAGMKMMSGDKQSSDDFKPDTDEMKAFLGDRYAAYQEYQKGIPDRAQLTQISSQLTARQLPLRPDQSNGLLQIMQQEKLNTAKFAAANTDPNNRRFDQKIIDDTLLAAEDRNSRILARSKTLLTPEQWNALGDQQKQTLQMQKMGMEMAKTMFPKN